MISYALELKMHDVLQISVRFMRACYTNNEEMTRADWHALTESRDVRFRFPRDMLGRAVGCAGKVAVFLTVFAFVAVCQAHLLQSGARCQEAMDYAHGAGYTLSGIELV